MARRSIFEFGIDVLSTISQALESDIPGSSNAKWDNLENKPLYKPTADPDDVRRKIYWTIKDENLFLTQEAKGEDVKMGWIEIGHGLVGAKKLPISDANVINKMNLKELQELLYNITNPSMLERIKGVFQRRVVNLNKKIKEQRLRKTIQLILEDIE
tara:strand:+ start:154 stop:624 length:471 start_codon:yes stop_codon:yes gene_type:complete